MDPVIEHYLLSLDDAWSHGWESLALALIDLTPEEAVWQHESYAKVEINEGEQLPGSVLWHIVHTEQCERQYAEMLRTVQLPKSPTPPHKNSDNLELMLQAMNETHVDLRNAIAAKRLDELSLMYDKVGSGYHGKTIDEFIRVIIRHITWHAGEIMVARRLYRERSK